jgi:GNAT superfamily N-acetyltransferase
LAAKPNTAVLDTEQSRKYVPRDSGVIEIRGSAVHMNCRGKVREMEIRDAAMEDAAGACEVMRRSIAELCVVDHRGDVDVLARWLSNKTPDTFRSWIAHQGNSVLVAVEQDVILGVGAVTETGEITLNYVSPDARFRGVSRAVLGALEGRAMKQGNVRCTLTSTETARRFYRANGYVEDRLPAEEFSTSGCPMSKVLTLGNS